MIFLAFVSQYFRATLPLMRNARKRRGFGGRADDDAAIYRRDDGRQI
jgi:hypothetical protein